MFNAERKRKAILAVISVSKEETALNLKETEGKDLPEEAFGQTFVFAFKSRSINGNQPSFYFSISGEKIPRDSNSQISTAMMPGGLSFE